MQIENNEDLRNMVANAPIGICVLDAATLVSEITNEKFLEVAAKEYDEIVGRFYWDCFAEVRKYYESALNNVIKDGIPYYANEVELPLIRHGIEEMVFVTFVYVPLKNNDGDVAKIAVWVLENTLQVIERQKIEAINRQMEKAQAELQRTFLQLEESEIALRLAIAAANFGTWYIHSVTREFITDARLKELFGYRPDEDISIEGALAQITEEYRGYVATTLENAIYKGGDYDVTYPVIGFHDNKLRWLRAIGNLKADPSGEFSAFTGVVMDISEQKKDEQRKNDFIGMVSHELKTPLTSLNAYLQLLQRNDGKMAAGFAREALEQSVKQVKKMTTLINGFLNVSRLESGKIYIDKTQFDMADLLQEIKQEMLVMVTTHKIIFHPVEPTLVNADRDKIGQVINNFISNAVKYSPPDSSIQVSCITAGNMAKVSVSDRGIGIKREDIDQLFERFYRVTNNNHVSGFGIGLYLCAEIIKRHHGKIAVESDWGNGSDFYFTLPLSTSL